MCKVSVENWEKLWNALQRIEIGKQARVEIESSTDCITYQATHLPADLAAYIMSYYPVTKISYDTMATFFTQAVACNEHV